MSRKKGGGHHKHQCQNDDDQALKQPQNDKTVFCGQTAVKQTLGQIARDPEQCETDQQADQSADKCLNDGEHPQLAGTDPQQGQRGEGLTLARDLTPEPEDQRGGQTQTGAVNTPLRGRKGQLLEGGIRVPMCLRWPGRVEPGTTIADPVISLDLLPTFVAAAGGAVKDEWQLDGGDLTDTQCNDPILALAVRSLWHASGPKRLDDPKTHAWCDRQHVIDHDRLLEQ